MAQPDTLLYLRTPGQRCLAVVEDGRVVELHLHRPDMLAGAVVLGRVGAMAPGTTGLFVDIGQPRAGFLAQPSKAGPKQTQGQAALVQIRSDAVHGKGATVSADISFQGRWLSYAPGRPGLAASRKLPDDERERLLGLLSGLVREGEGITIRPNAAGLDIEPLARDLAQVRGHWAHIQTAKAEARAPAVLWRPDPMERLLAHYPSVRTVRACDAALLAEIRPLLGDTARLDTIDAKDQIEAALDEACATTLPLPSGGRISIGALAAVTAIDVDSGAGAPEAANREAVAAIAAQVRLRGLGGQMVVDFIPNGGKGGLAACASSLKRALAKDPVPTTVLGTTPMGLVEITRERRGPSIPELLLEVPEPRWTDLSLGLRALQAAVEQSAFAAGRALVLALSPPVAVALETERTALAEARTRIQTGLSLRKDPARARDDFSVEVQSLK